MNKIETDYQRKLKVKKRHQAAFRRFIRGEGTPVKVREWIGLNWQETRILLESRMLSAMSWANYGTHWVVDHVVPFWLFDPESESDMKLLWHPDNLMPMVWKDNNHKQGDLRFALLILVRRKGYSLTTEMLITRCEDAIKVQDKYIYPEKKPL